MLIFKFFLMDFKFLLFMIIDKLLWVKLSLICVICSFKFNILFFLVRVVNFIKFLMVLFKLILGFKKIIFIFL